MERGFLHCFGMTPTEEAIDLRRRSGLSRPEFGAALDVTRWTVWRWETEGKSGPSRRDLAAMRAVVAEIEAAAAKDAAA